MQETWGMQNTHNTGDCKKCNLDRTPKKGFAGKNTQHNTHNEHTSREQNASYTQLSVKIAKVKKSNQKLKRMKKKCKRHYISESNSDDSNSS